MSLFIRQQLSPYCHEVVVHRVSPRGLPWTDWQVQPTMKLDGPTPHGRNDYTGNPDDWGPDVYGYTDFDDYHLAIYGA